MSSHTNCNNASDSREDNWKYKTDYRWLKDQGFNGRYEFGLAYGEKPTPDGFHNSKVIMGTLWEDDPASTVGKWYRDEKAKGKQPTLI